MVNKPIDRRATPRFCVQFQAAFSGEQEYEGNGTVLDFSFGGCKVDSATMLASGLTLEMRIDVPDLDGPLIVDSIVRWTEAQQFGLNFLAVRDTEQARLRQVIAALAE